MYTYGFVSSYVISVFPEFDTSYLVHAIEVARRLLLTKVGNNTFCSSEDNFPKLKERHCLSFRFAASGLFLTNCCAAGHERQFAKK